MSRAVALATGSGSNEEGRAVVKGVGEVKYAQCCRRGREMALITC